MRSSTLFAIMLLFSACESRTSMLNSKSASADTSSATKKPDNSSPVTKTPRKAAEILKQRQVPILCYHRIREFKPTDTRSMKDYIVTPENFRAQLKMLADSGYHTILPDELYAYLLYGAALPNKPIMLTFDDSEEEHYTIASTEMKKYGFKAAFFIMTVTMNRPGYLTKDEIKSLSDQGNEIAAHTWDHHNVKKYVEKDWTTQVEKPMSQLQAITGKPVRYFAYPFGLWNEEAIPQLKKRGIVAAFQLVDKRDSTEPLYTIRRTIVPGEWTNERLMKSIKSNFN